MTIFENKTKITVFIDPIKESLYGKTEGMTKLEVIFEDAHNSGKHRFTFTNNQQGSRKPIRIGKKNKS